MGAKGEDVKGKSGALVKRTKRRKKLHRVRGKKQGVPKAYTKIYRRRAHGITLTSVKGVQPSRDP